MNNNPIGWPDNAFGYNASTQTLTAPTVAATKTLTAPTVAATRTVTINAPSTYTGNFLDMQLGGASQYRFGSPTALSGWASLTVNASNGFLIALGATAVCTLNGSSGLQITAGVLSLSSGHTGPIGDVQLSRDAANVLAQRNGTNAQTFRVYNTYTSSTNHERGKLEWASNTFCVGTEKGSGGGTARSMALQTDATDRLTIDTIGSVRVTTGLTVATLPASPTVGMIARVTDASVPAVGSIVAGGGAAAALCWYNGTNWTVLGI